MAKVELGDWNEHWQRVLRWEARLNRICHGLPPGITRADAIDEVLAFFPTCYHLRDSLIRSAHLAEKQVDGFIMSNDPLALCRDLATAVKHFEVRQPYRPTTYATTSHMQVVHHGLRPPCEPVPGENWSVVTDAGHKDMFALANECVDAWRGYLEREGLLRDDQNDPTVS
jgi:hypothetical protein